MKVIVVAMHTLGIPRQMPPSLLALVQRVAFPAPSKRENSRINGYLNCGGIFASLPLYFLLIGLPLKPTVNVLPFITLIFSFRVFIFILLLYGWVRVHRRWNHPYHPTLLFDNQLQDFLILLIRRHSKQSTVLNLFVCTTYDTGNTIKSAIVVEKIFQCVVVNTFAVLWVLFDQVANGFSRSIAMRRRRIPRFVLFPSLYISIWVRKMQSWWRKKKKNASSRIRTLRLLLALPESSRSVFANITRCTKIVRHDHVLRVKTYQLALPSIPCLAQPKHVL